MKMPVSALAALFVAAVVATSTSGVAAKRSRDNRPAAAASTVIKYIASGELTLPDSVGAQDLRNSVATDADGNVYASYLSRDFHEDVAVFDSKGKYLRSWRLGKYGNYPSRFAIGPDGLLYATGDPDNLGGNIEVFKLDGTHVRQFGAGSDGSLVNDIEVDAGGNVFVTQRPNRPGVPDDYEIARFDRSGNVTARFTPVRTGSARLRGLAPAPDGSIWVAAYDDFNESINPRLVHIHNSGQALPSFRMALPGGPDDVDFANGRLYVSGELRGPARTDHTLVALAVYSTKGELIDFSVGRGDQVAVHGVDVYVTGLRTAGRASASGGRSTQGQLERLIDHIRQIEAYRPPPSASSPGAQCGSVSNSPTIGTLINMYGGKKCNLNFYNWENPCRKLRNQPGRPVDAQLAGEQVGTVEPLSGGALVRIPAGEVASGSLVVAWACRDPVTGRDSPLYEVKGAVELIDPSGTVLDAKTGRPIEAARVQLEFAPSKTSRLGIPGLSAISPQVNPQTTGPQGFFGWNVAPGFWRLRITAFGYRRFTSAVYKVPPEVTGLKLKLRHNTAEQRRLIDPRTGRVGDVRLGSRVKHVAGLKLRVVAGKVRAVIVRAKRFRTAHGVKLGSLETDLFAAYPSLAQKRPRATSRIHQYRVARALFTVKRGRIVGITVTR